MGSLVIPRQERATRPRRVASPSRPAGFLTHTPDVDASARDTPPGGRSVIGHGSRVTNRMPSSREAGDPVRWRPM